tara:strand:+ start:187 stop:555 length:369 start_codon:yes stop_codon:yes gene_type:complete
MIYKIAHRGNTKGKIPEKENSVSYILDAAKDHFVEVDVWYKKGEFWLGHDEPTHLVDVLFLLNEKLFCHAKNEAALHEMTKRDIHCFWHESDQMTLTSKGFIWKYPEVYRDGNLFGICSDWL